VNEVIKVTKRLTSAGPKFSDSVLKSNVKTLTFGPKSVFTVSIGVSSQEKTLDYSNQDFGPGELMLISSLVIPFSPALTALNVMKNPIGEDGLAALVSAIEGTAVKTISGMTEVQTSLDRSNQN
jgi:hypothetical protein